MTKEQDKDLEKLKKAVDENDAEKEKEVEKTIQQLKEEQNEPSAEELYADSLVKIDELNATIETLKKEKEDAELKLKNQKEANIRLINRLETREPIRVEEKKTSYRDNFDEKGNFKIFKN